MEHQALFDSHFRRLTDDNNLVLAGMNTTDMALASNTIFECGGAQVVVEDGEVKTVLELPIGSITTDATPEKLAKKENELKSAAELLGSRLPDPMFYLLFLHITSIPDPAITNGGNVDYTKLRYFDSIVAYTRKTSNPAD
jgi:adenine deaminase